VVALVAIVLVILGFLSGSIPFGLLVATQYGMDIRRVGSGNIGMTNVWRVLGWKPGVAVLLLDMAKGLVPVLVAVFFLTPTYTTGATGWTIGIFPELSLGSGTSIALAIGKLGPLFVGFAAVLGHTFTPWLGFKGGKGVATGLGVAIALYGYWILIPAVVFLIALLLSRMVSVSSVSAAVALAVIGFIAAPANNPNLWVGIQQWRLWPFGILIAMFVFYTHRSNIRRILDGTENKVSFRRKPAAS
jgi:glycerol-3-phosphate acyltransferase PlsY